MSRKNKREPTNIIRKSSKSNKITRIIITNNRWILCRVVWQRLYSEKKLISFGRAQKCNLVDPAIPCVNSVPMSGILSNMRLCSKFNTPFSLVNRVFCLWNVHAILLCSRIKRATVWLLGDGLRKLIWCLWCLNLYICWL